MMAVGKGLAGQGWKGDALPKKKGDFLLGFRQEEYLALYVGGVEVMFYVLKVLEVMRCVLLCMLDAVEGVGYVLELLNVIPFVVEVVDCMRRVCWWC